MHGSDEEPLKIGELARRAGLTVRTLHHYEAIGLLAPSERTSAGHRLYRHAEIGRLYRIVALRSLGVPLDRIGELLVSDGEDPRIAVRDHLAELDERIRGQRELRRRLVRILDALERMQSSSNAEYLTAIEGMTMLEKHYTPAQLDWLADRREQLGEDAIGDVEDEWPRLYADMRAQMRRGADPAAPRAQEIAVRMRELVALFDGANAGVKQSLDAVWMQTPREEMIARLEAQGVADAASRIPDAELSAYIERAHAAAG